jgi:hypothetical protein
MAYIRSGGGAMETPTLLWENPNPNSAYAGNSYININWSDYDYLVIRLKNTVSSTQDQYTKDFIVAVDSPADSFIVGLGYLPNNDANASFRYVRVNQYGVVFGTGTSTYQWQTSSNIAIPLAIYGLKKNPIKL